MSSEIAKCRITVLKRTVNEDLIEEYLEEEHKDRGPCEFFKEGQKFIIDPWVVPEEFCACCSWAWADIRKDILTVAIGGNMPGIRPRGTLITGCRDWFRPVIFKVERIEAE
jgi:uncharacterized repeat protein (TIGR04076 family)